MDKKEEFKEFIRQRPKLIKYVKSGDMSWQKFYEIYDLYGKDDNIWKDYLEIDESHNHNTRIASTLTFTEILNFIKGIDLDTLQESVNSLQRVIGVFGDMVANKNSETTKDNYKPRPLYKHFDD